MYFVLVLVFTCLHSIVPEFDGAVLVAGGNQVDGQRFHLVQGRRVSLCALEDDLRGFLKLLKATNCV